MRVERRIKAFIDSLGGSSAKLTRKDSFRVSENLHFYFGGEEICIVKRG